MSVRERDKKGRNVLARCVVICIAAALISFSVFSGVCVATPQQTEDTVKVTVNAPEVINAGETFDVTIDIEGVTNLNIAQFDLAFAASVVDVKDVAGGCIDDKEIPISMWDHVGSDTIQVISALSGDAGANGSGYLARITFEVKGKERDKTVLDISEIVLYNNVGEEIPAKGINAKLRVGIAGEEEEGTGEETPTPTPTSRPAIPGFKAIFAIAVMSAIGYILLKRR